MATKEELPPSVTGDIGIYRLNVGVRKRLIKPHIAGRPNDIDVVLGSR